MDEIAKFSILDGKMEFTILDGIWTENGKMANCSPKRIIKFFHIHWLYCNVFTVRLRKRMPRTIPKNSVHCLLLQHWTKRGQCQQAVDSRLLVHRCTTSNHGTPSMIDARGTSKRPSLCRTWVSSSREMWYLHSELISICLQRIPVQ